MMGLDELNKKTAADLAALTRQIEFHQAEVDRLTAQYNNTLVAHCRQQDLVDEVLNVAQLMVLTGLAEGTIRNAMSRPPLRDKVTKANGHTGLRYGDAKDTLCLGRRRTKASPNKVEMILSLAKNPNLTQTEIANTVGLSLSTVTRVLRNARSET
jgi:hypothetical protein